MLESNKLDEKYLRHIFKWQKKRKMVNNLQRLLYWKNTQKAQDKQMVAKFIMMHGISAVLWQQCLVRV